MEKPKIGSKVIYVRPTANKNIHGPSISIGTVCTVDFYVNDDGINASFNKGNNSVFLFWDEFRELTMLEKELYED